MTTDSNKCFGNVKVGFVGAGNIASALISGFVSSGNVTASQVMASGPHIEKLEHLKTLGVHVTTSNTEVANNVDVVFLCVKPFKFTDVAKEISGIKNLGKPPLVVSVMTGISVQSMTEIFPHPIGVIRAMPNMLAKIKCSTTIYCTSPHVTNEQCHLVEGLLRCIGTVYKIEESQMNAATALAGSGPAYIYTVIDALSDGGVKMGLPRDIATQMAAEMVCGAGKMVSESHQHPGVLKNLVCSPGGTTIHAIHVLESKGVRDAFIGAVEAACYRAAEMAKPK